MLTGQILLQLLVILLIVQLFGFLCQRIGQQWVIGEILAGIALGPSLLGAFLPGIKAMIFPTGALPTLQTLGDIGLVLYMFSLGARLDTHQMLRQSGKAAIASLSGILLPLLLGAALAFFLYPALAGTKANLFSFMLMVGTAMAITAFPALALALLMLSAYCTNAIGIHPVFGAFLMGIILPRRAVFVDYISSIDRLNSTLLLPLFFVYSGLRTQIGLISAPALWLICVLALAVACVGKLLGGTLSMRSMGESWREALSLGVLMNTRGLVELIVLNIGLDLKVLSPTLFAMLVIMALVTTMMASPLLSWLGYRGQSQPLLGAISTRARRSRSYRRERADAALVS